MNLKRQMRVRLNKQTISFAGVDANIIIFIVIVLGVNGALHKYFHSQLFTFIYYITDEGLRE